MSAAEHRETNLMFPSRSVDINIIITETRLAVRVQLVPGSTAAVEMSIVAVHTQVFTIAIVQSTASTSCNPLFKKKQETRKV